MIQLLLANSAEERSSVPKEGDLYKVVTVCGRTFELYYGYYDECERSNPSVDPMPIYPDFVKDPLYTDQGYPFVTKMQDSCKSFKGRSKKFSDCGDCRYFKHGDELLGVCTCAKNKKESVSPDDGSEHDSL